MSHAGKVFKTAYQYPFLPFISVKKLVNYRNKKG